ncbi:hypothetical protein K501DRAFT_333684 [Backusella circina FSU 941]|nr:hypothetical protein K501DRAFT_333684 [Backusella circina FSU 941]
MMGSHRERQICPIVLVTSTTRTFLRARKAISPRLTSCRVKKANNGTRDQIERLIGYTVDNMMFIQVAFIQANMAIYSAKIFYSKYLNDPNHELPTPKRDTSFESRSCTQEQMSEQIGGLVNDKMTLSTPSVNESMSEKMETASMKAKAGDETDRKYYRLYLDNPNLEIAAPPQASLRSENALV